MMENDGFFDVAGGSGEELSEEHLTDLVNQA